MASGDDKEWLFFKLYVNHPNHLDSLVREAVGPAVNKARGAAEVDRWFFLRYFDESGYHLRLRFKSTADGANSIYEAVNPFLSRAVEEICRRTAPDIKRIVPLEVPVIPGDPGCTLSFYEPEYDKYGGPRGVELAEEAFQISSELVLNILSYPGLSSPDLVGLALLLMAGCARQWSDSPTDLEEFWDSYHIYWSGEDVPGAEALQTSFKQGAAKRRELINQQCRSLMDNSEWVEIVSSYTAAMGDNFERAKKFELEVPIRDLSFNHIHLTNNRLGILPIEESYLAAMVQQIEGDLNTVE